MNRKKWFIGLLCIVMLLVSGCGQEVQTGAAGCEHWTSWPQMNYGTLEYEKLTVQPWNCGRWEAISGNRAAETEKGYYFLHSQILYYADKSDLGTWVPVCNRPDCEHVFGMEVCNAHYTNSNFIIKNQRIYYIDQADRYPELYQTKKVGFGVFSRALDGTDTRLEYINEDMLITPSGKPAYYYFSHEHWLSYTAELNPDGTYALKFWRVTEDGVELLVNETVDNYQDDMHALQRTLSAIGGESSFNHRFLGDTPYLECRYKDGEPYFTDLTGYFEEGRYLSGNTLRLFRKNDGYYDVDLTTREEVRIADTRLENSDSFVFLPNCIVESTLYFSVHDQLPAGEKHAMEIFDGESWRSVELPQELQTAEKGKYLWPRFVSSDSIFFIRQVPGVKPGEETVHLYRIPIQDGQLRMEYCGTVKTIPEE